MIKKIIIGEDDVIGKLINHISLEDKKETLTENLDNSKNSDDINIDDINLI